MISLFLDNVRLYPESGENIKLTKQNPYFSLAGTYTLDVTLPMDIWENRQFFGSISRMETTKNPRSMTCRLTNDNATIMVGLAHITEVTEKSVKVQLVGGNSEINFLSEEGGAYIDEMEYYLMRSYITVHFDAVDFVRDLRAVDLYGVIQNVIVNCGFRITESVLNQAGSPWINLWIVPRDSSDVIVNQLPHWKASEFIQQVSRLFNVTFIADSVTHTVRIVSNRQYVADAPVTIIEPVDEYKVEMNDDSGEAEVQALANANIRYDMQQSEYHDNDCLQDDVRKMLQRLEYNSYADLEAAWRSMNAGERKRYLFICPQGCYASWTREKLWFDDQPVESLTYIDCFRPLVRDAASDEYMELKIVPVGMRQDYHEYQCAFDKYLWRYVHVPATTGSENGMKYSIPEGDASPITVQEAVTEGIDVEDKEGKEDVLEIVFGDSNFEHVYFQERYVKRVYGYDPGSIAGWQDYDETGTVQHKWRAFFTDWKLKPGIWSNTPVNRWSLSLNPVADADHYLGELHSNPYSLNMKARHVFQFLSDVIPDPSDIFLVRGKRYACEKIEANIRDNKIDRLMTGYFYEIEE